VLLSDWPTTRVSATRAEAAPLLAGVTDKRIRVVLGTIKKAKPTAMRNRRCGEGLESAKCEYAKSDAARMAAPPRRHCRGGCLVAQPTRQRRRDSHGEGLKRKQHPGVLRRHIVLLLKQKTKRRRQAAVERLLRNAAINNAENTKLLNSSTSTTGLLCLLVKDQRPPSFPNAFLSPRSWYRYESANIE
jgi:hypothetical protein